MSKNAEGWIRHRGGKCPVEAGTLVDVRYRSGIVNEHVKSLESVNSGKSVGLSAVTWEHYGSIHDIMAYRLHKPAERVEACSKPKVYSGTLRSVEVIEQDGPLQWRDRIAEIYATTQALTTERAELVQKLASEGFALIGRVVEPVEDMSDWRNWKVGDEVVAGVGCGGFSFHGEVVKIIEIAKSGSMKVARLREPDYGWLFTTSEVESDLSFHSRPSA